MPSVTEFDLSSPLQNKCEILSGANELIYKYRQMKSLKGRRGLAISTTMANIQAEPIKTLTTPKKKLEPVLLKTASMSTIDADANLNDKIHQLNIICDQAQEANSQFSKTFRYTQKIFRKSYNCLAKEMRKLE